MKTTKHEVKSVKVRSAFDKKPPLEQAQICEELALKLSHLHEQRMLTSIRLAHNMDKLITELVKESKEHRAQMDSPK